MGANRPRTALFVSQDDGALELSQLIWGGVQRIGEIDPNKEPYRSQLAHDGIIVFDLTALKSSGDNAHSRAFDDITAVMALVRTRLGEEQTKAAKPGTRPATGKRVTSN
jgi:esterase/lipase superfamily enzyme